MAVPSSRKDAPIADPSNMLGWTLFSTHNTVSTLLIVFSEYEFQHGYVQMFLKNLCILVLWVKLASALKGLIH